MVYIIVAAAIIPLVIGLLLGAMRGSRRALLRLILVILCLVAAFCLKGVATDWAMQFEVEGQPLDQYILSQLGDYAAMGEVIMPVIQLIVMAVVFLALFFGIKLISWIIIFPICKIFVKKARKKKDGSYGNKHALIGGVIGLVQGAAVAVVLCVILNGLFLNIANVAESIDSFSDNSQAEAVAEYEQDDGEQIDDNQQETTDGQFDLFKSLADYKQSKICNMLTATGGNKVFDLVVSMKDEDGKTLTLTGQLDAVNGLVKMAKELMAIQNVDMTGGLSGDVATSVAQIFTKLDEINDSLSDESKETINHLLQTVADNLMPNMGINMAVLDLKTVNFGNEAEVLTKLNQYKDEDFSNLTDEQAKQKATEIVNTVMQSDILLPILSSNSEFTIGLEGENKEFAQEMVNDLASQPDANAEKIDMLKTFFGLNDNVDQSE